MGLIATLQNQLDKAVSQLGYIKRDALVSPRTLFASEVRPGEEYDVYANYTQNELYKLAVTNYSIYRNIMLLAKLIAGGRIMTQERDESEDEGWKEIRDHDFSLKIDYRPNPFMSQSLIWMYQIFWLLLSGEAYWLIFKNQMGEIAEIYPLPANRVKPIPDPVAGIKVFAYTPLDGRYPTLIDPAQICFHRLPNPFEYWRGLSPLSAYLMGLAISTEAQKTDLEDYKNRLSLQHLVSLRSGMPDREFNVAEADIKSAVAQGMRWKIIRAGDAKVDAISQPRNEYSKEVFNITESIANSIYGIPDAYWSQEKAYKQGDAYNQLINDTVWPLMNLLSEDLTVQMVERYYGENYRAMFEDLRPKNIELDLKQAESDREVQTYDEARGLKGLLPHPEPSIGLAPAKVAGQIAVELIKMGRLIDGTAEINAAVQEALASGQPASDEVPMDDEESIVSNNGKH
jgi:hypothetical protein